MTQVTFQGAPVEVSGIFPQSGDRATNFTLCAADLSDITLADLQGKNVVMNIFPSIDTPVCAASVRVFNEKAVEMNNTVVLCISADLPFATGRFCAAENIDNVKTASFFRAAEFAENYGVNLNAGALRGLAARSVIVINEAGFITHCELVQEITDEPNYDAALASLGNK